MYGTSHLEGVVTSRRDLTPELWIIRVRPRAPVRFVPGQYVTVGLWDGSKLIERPYSVAAAPHEEELEFFLEAVSGGKLSPRLYQVPVGGPVYLRPTAKGRFTFDPSASSHFMIATVTGVAPFVSMVRHLALQASTAEPASSRVAILQGASVPAELGYHEELSALASRHSWLEYIPTISRIWLEPGWPGERGRVDDIVRKHLDTRDFHPQSTIVYLCGNPRMISSMEAILARAGFDRSSLRQEAFWPL